MKTVNQSIAMMQRAVSLHKQGQIPEAERFYREVLADNPSHVDALRLLGSLYIHWKKNEQAVGCFEKALSIDPDQPEVLTNLGVALYTQGRLNEAVLRYEQAIKIAPDYCDAITNLGNAYYACGKLDDATVWLERSVRLRPNNPQTHIVLGHVFRAQKKESQAITYYKHALKLLPDNVEVLTNLGNILRETGKSEEACAIYHRLVELQPENVNVILNLGTIFHDMGKWDEAMKQYENLLKLQPNSADAMMCRASLLMELNRPDEARAGYEQSLNVNPHSPDAKWGKSLAMLMLGEYQEGWAQYESRFEYKAQRHSVLFRDSRWEGCDLNGKRLLIWGEQGLGDVLQFVRYAALCKERGGKIIILCRAPLARLLKNCPYIDEVVTAATKEDFDYQIPVMSLPHIFSTTLDTVPQNAPYLYVSEEARSKWRPRFADTNGFKVGLVWAGNPRKGHIDAHIADRRRSMTLELLKPILNFDQCFFYNLQKGDAASEINASGLYKKLIDYMPEVEDFMDTAAIIENLDLVISVDTSVVHLAGGLGKSVWVLSRFGGCWRWLRNQELNPWYQTARVFGQPAPDDWKGCIEKVCGALLEKLKLR